MAAVTALTLAKELFNAIVRPQALMHALAGGELKSGAFGSPDGAQARAQPAKLDPALCGDTM
jgi:hypothetical protein